MSNPANTVLQIFRIIGDRRVAYYLELDATMTVVADRPAELLQPMRIIAPSPSEDDVTAAVAAAVTQAAIQNSAVKQYQAVDGARIEAQQAAVKSVIDKAIAQGAQITTTIPEVLDAYPELASPPADGIVSKSPLPGGGNHVVYKPTPLDITVGSWVTSLVTTNPIPGTDDLRAEFFAAEQSIRDRHAENGTICKPCEIGSLIRKYRAQLEELGFIPK